MDLAVFVYSVDGVRVTNNHRWTGLTLWIHMELFLSHNEDFNHTKHAPTRFILLGICYLCNYLLLGYNFFLDFVFDCSDFDHAHTLTIFFGTNWECSLHTASH